MERFVMSPVIYMGDSCCEEIQSMDIKKAYVICDPFMFESGKTKLITDSLDKMGVPYEVFSKVVPDPHFGVVKECLSSLIVCKPDTVFAMGGGSAIDTAKAVLKIASDYGNVNMPKFVALPTTSGTGSEVTSFAVVTDKEAGIKYPIIDEDMVPDVVFLDPLLTATVPPSITADTGMDVLTHAMEAFVSTKSNDFTDALAEKAIRTVCDFLERCYTDGSDLNARAHMHNASCMAGAAFSVTSLGIAHSLAHALGERFHLPHGRCCAVFLPLVIEYNAGLMFPRGKNAELHYLNVARMLGISAGTNKATIHRLIREIRMLQQRIGVPTTFDELGIDKEVFMENIDRMATNALNDRCTATNPRVPTLEDLKGILNKLAQRK